MWHCPIGFVSWSVRLWFMSVNHDPVTVDYDERLFAGDFVFVLFRQGSTLEKVYQNMWCDQAKTVWSRSNSVFIFLTNCLHHIYSYVLVKTPLKLVNWFQRYEQLKVAKNNRKQKNIFCLVWLYLKIHISDFRLILLDHITLCLPVIPI